MLTAQWAAQVKASRYEAQRAQRQYSQVEPENRLVAGELEQRWEEKLRQLRNVEETAQRGVNATSAPQKITLSCVSNLPPLGAPARSMGRLHTCTAQNPAAQPGRTGDPETRHSRPGAYAHRVALRPLHRPEVQTPVGVQTTVNGYAAMVERVGALHAQGLDDTQIAAQLGQEGFHSNGAAMWRRMP
ncbi:MAG: hypothetical protein IPM84_26095 [Anaerolineae bacterium]|nr:hypothetical protein [Anaerolineae bacterium]